MENICKDYAGREGESTDQNDTGRLGPIHFTIKLSLLTHCLCQQFQFHSLISPV